MYQISSRVALNSTIVYVHCNDSSIISKKIQKKCHFSASCVEKNTQIFVRKSKEYSNTNSYYAFLSLSMYLDKLDGWPSKLSHQTAI